jgi:hypothetical protein
MTAGQVARGFLRFIVGSAIAAGAGFFLLGFFEELPVPDHRAHGFSFAAPLGVMALAGVAVFGVLMAFSAPFWRRVLWAVRVMILAVLILGWQFYPGTTAEQWGVAAGLLIALLVAHFVAHRYALGWIIDERGERQKVDHWNRGHAIFTPTTRSERIVKEGLRRNERRWRLAWSTPLFGGAAWLTWHFYKGDSPFAAIVPGLFALMFGLIWIETLISELLYIVGYQDMDGHKVLDKPAKRRGVEDVSRQKAHGDATVASEEEALGFLNSRR